MIKILIWFLLITFLTGCTTTQKSTPSYFEAVQSKHKIIAILPAVVKLFIPEYKKENVTEQDIKNAEREISFTIQNEMYKWFQKNKYTVLIQDIRYSNNKLFSNGLPFSEYNKISKDSIAKILGVDAVVYCLSDLTKVDFKSLNINLDFSNPLNAFISVIGSSVSASKKPQLPNSDIGLYFIGIDGATNYKLFEMPYKFNVSRREGLNGFYKNSIKNFAKIFPYKK